MWLWSLPILVLLVCMLVRVPRYTVVGLTLLLVLGAVSGFAVYLVAGSAFSLNSGSGRLWLTLTECAGGIYLTAGVWRIAISFVERRRFQVHSALQAQKEAERTAEREARRIQRRQLREGTASYKLGEFVRTSEAIQAACARARAVALGEIDADPALLLAGDAVFIIRSIALPSDFLRPEDVRCLKFAGKGARAVWASKSDGELMSLLETSPGSDHLMLHLLRDANSPALNELAERLAAFAEEVACREERKPTSIIVLQHLGQAARGSIETRDVSDDGPRARSDGAASLRTQATSIFAILGVPVDCSRDELRAAYLRKVTQWHPDQLQKMAPELREYATQELARINAAYQALSDSQ